MELLTATIITALVQGVKTTTGLSGRWNFVLAIGLGIAISVLVAFANEDFDVNAIVEGLVVGLAASGFYSGAVKGTIIKDEITLED